MAGLLCGAAWIRRIDEVGSESQGILRCRVDGENVTTGKYGGHLGGVKVKYVGSHDSLIVIYAASGICERLICSVGDRQVNGLTS